MTAPTREEVAAIAGRLTKEDREVTRPLLCRVGLHRWRFLAPNLTGTGGCEQCRRCHRRRWLDFASGAYFYED